MWVRVRGCAAGSIRKTPSTWYPRRWSFLLKLPVHQRFCSWTSRSLSPGDNINHGHMHKLVMHKPWTWPRWSQYAENWYYYTVVLLHRCIIITLRICNINAKLQEVHRSTRTRDLQYVHTHRKRGARDHFTILPDTSCSHLMVYIHVPSSWNRCIIITAHSSIITSRSKITVCAK